MPATEARRGSREMLDLIERCQQCREVLKAQVALTQDGERPLPAEKIKEIRDYLMKRHEEHR